MASFSGPLHRPLSAMAVAAFATVTSFELPDRLSNNHRLDDANSDTVMSLPPASKPTEPSAPSASLLSSGLQFFPRNHHKAAFDLSAAKAPVASLPVINTVHQYARFARAEASTTAAVPSSSCSSDALYRWHLPHPGRSSDDDRSQTVVVLLGWLGSKQKHLKRYAEWYTSRGFHAVTFTLPMSDIVSYNVGGKAERNVEMLSEHLTDWVREEDGKKIVFHTFSNTGWLCYGVILENLQRQDPSAVQKIKGSIVDSAPVAVPDSQVWALGFSAAIMKKHSVATKGAVSNDTRSDVLVVESQRDIKPAATEAVLLSALEKFFDVVLNYPAINRKLSGVMETLSSNQPNCPQLYIYSSADRVIPAKSVEEFVESQRRAGCEVRSCDFVSSPHVDHYRSNPGLYTSQLTKFLEDCVLARRREDSSLSSSSPPA